MWKNGRPGKPRQYELYRQATEAGGSEAQVCAGGGTGYTQVYDHEGGFVTTLPRGKIKPGTLAAILKQMGISKKQLEKML